MPLAAYADWQADGSLRLDAAWGDPSGQQTVVRVNGQAQVHTLAEAEALGQRVAADLRAAGATPPPVEV
jgi:hydroxymethylbilane synthase